MDMKQLPVKLSTSTFYFCPLPVFCWSAVCRWQQHDSISHHWAWGSASASLHISSSLAIGHMAAWNLVMCFSYLRLVSRLRHMKHVVVSSSSVFPRMIFFQGCIYSKLISMKMKSKRKKWTWMFSLPYLCTGRRMQSPGPGMSGRLESGSCWGTWSCCKPQSHPLLATQFLPTTDVFQ